MYKRTHEHTLIRVWHISHLVVVHNCVYHDVCADERWRNGIQNWPSPYHKSDMDDGRMLNILYTKMVCAQCTRLPNAHIYVYTIQRGASYRIQRCAHTSSNPYIIHLCSIFIWILLPACLLPLPLSECSLFCAFIFLSFAISTHIWWRVEKCAREDNPNEYEIHRFAFLSFHRTTYTECGRCCYTLARTHTHTPRSPGPGLIRSNKV